METIFKEKKQTPYGQFGLWSQPKPAYSTFNGTDDKLYKAVANFNSGNASGYIKAYWNVIAGTNVIFGSADVGTSSKYFILNTVDGVLKFLVYKDGAVLNRIQHITAMSYGWHEIEFGSTGVAYYIKIDGASITISVSAGSDDGAWFSKCTNPIRDNITIGMYDRLADVFGVGSGAWVEVDGTNKWILTGTGKYIYDVIGTSHLLYTGTGSKIAYDKTASFHLANLKGYSKFIKVGELDEYVPYTEAGVPQSPAELSTYTKDYDSPASPDYWNLAPAVFNFNPAGLIGETKLDVFDKSNSTIHIATGSMLYYNAANPFEWRIDELLDYVVYNAYFNGAYQDRLFTKVENNLLKEVLNYANKKTGNDLLKIKEYCLI